MSDPAKRSVTREARRAILRVFRRRSRGDPVSILMTQDPLHLGPRDTRRRSATWEPLRYCFLFSNCSHYSQRGICSPAACPLARIPRSTPSGMSDAKVLLVRHWVGRCRMPPIPTYGVLSMSTPDDHEHYRRLSGTLRQIGKAYFSEPVRLLPSFAVCICRNRSERQSNNSHASGAPIPLGWFHHCRSRRPCRRFRNAYCVPIRRDKHHDPTRQGE